MQLTVNDIIKTFAVPEETVNEWIESRGLPFTRADQQYRFNHIELLDWALSHKIPLTPEALSFGEGDARPSGIVYDALINGKIFYDVPGVTRDEVLKSVVDRLPLPEKTNKANLWQMLVVREKFVSTTVGGGIALPHVRSPLVLDSDRASITLCFLQNPVDFGSHDGQPVSILFVLLNPSVKSHLAILSRLAYCLQVERLRNFLQNRAPYQEILAEIKIIESRLSLRGDRSMEGKIM